MKRIITIAAAIFAAIGAMAQEKGFKEIDFNYKRFFDIDFLMYDADQDGQADDNEIFAVPEGGKITAYIIHNYYGEAGNTTTLEATVKSPKGDMVFKGTIDGSHLVTYDKDTGTYFHCIDGMDDIAFVVVKGDVVDQPNLLMIFNIGAFLPVK